MTYDVIMTNPDGTRIGIKFDIDGYVTCGRCGTDRKEGDCLTCITK